MDRAFGASHAGPAIADKGGSAVFAATKPAPVGVVLVRGKVVEPTKQGAELDRRMNVHASVPTIVDHGSRLVFSTMNTRAAERARKTKQAS